MSIYGIELLADNVAECRATCSPSSLTPWVSAQRASGPRPPRQCSNVNIVHGDALSMTTQEPAPQPITFAEWSYLGKGRYHRRDFRFDTLTHMSAFGAEDTLFADLGKHEIFTPTRDHGHLSVGRDRHGGQRMAEHVALRLRNRNPDVLTCIANLSNDEVFTPPELANQMLDLLAAAWADAHGGASIWADPSVRFLDPFTKSGVFLREITKRLTEGLTDEIPDLEERVDHILTKQVFGIAITAAHEPDRPAQRLLLEVGQRQALDRRVVRLPTTATSGSSPWSTPGSAATEFVETADANGKPIRRGPTAGAATAGPASGPWTAATELETHAYALHPHRRHQGSDRRAVRRRHAVRRDHRQPAVPVGAERR